jgi:hypothetical protein
LEVLDRRTCILLKGSGESGLTTSFGAERPTHFLCTHGLDVGGDDEKARRQAVRSWTVGSFEELRRDVDGWVRTRLFKVLDHSTVGTAIEKAQVSPYFVVHGASQERVICYVDLSVRAEFTFPAASLNPTFREIVNTPLVSKVREWAPYKAYPSIAQGNVGVTVK